MNFMLTLTDREKSDIMKDMVILTDTREQKNGHILDYFDCIGATHREEKLETADYTFILPNYPDLNLDGAILIEKKNSLDEIAGNFTRDRERFVREFERIQEEHLHLVIEGASWKKLLNGNYRSQFHPKSFMASLITFNVRYGCPVWFVNRDESPVLIYNLLYYELKEHLNNL